jgi:hypothetical protein
MRKYCTYSMLPSGVGPWPARLPAARFAGVDIDLDPEATRGDDAVRGTNGMLAERRRSR